MAEMIADADPSLGGDRPLSRLKRALTDNPPVYDSRLLTVPDNDDGEHRIVITIDSLISVLLPLDKQADCRHIFVILDGTLDERLTFLAAPNMNVSALDCLNAAIRDSRDDILRINENFVTDRLEKHERCRRELFLRQHSRAGDPIALEKVQAIFLILAGGLVIGVSLFVFELAGHVLMDRQRSDIL